MDEIYDSEGASSTVWEKGEDPAPKDGEQSSGVIGKLMHRISSSSLMTFGIGRKKKSTASFDNSIEDRKTSRSERKSRRKAKKKQARDAKRPIVADVKSENDSDRYIAEKKELDDSSFFSFYKFRSPSAVFDGGGNNVIDQQVVGSPNSSISELTAVGIDTGGGGRKHQRKGFVCSKFKSRNSGNAFVDIDEYCVRCQFKDTMHRICPRFISGKYKRTREFCQDCGRHEFDHKPCSEYERGELQGYLKKRFEHRNLKKEMREQTRFSSTFGDAGGADESGKMVQSFSVSTFSSVSGLSYTEAVAVSGKNGESLNSVAQSGSTGTPNSQEALNRGEHLSGLDGHSLHSSDRNSSSSSSSDEDGFDDVIPCGRCGRSEEDHSDEACGKFDPAIDFRKLLDNGDGVELSENRVSGLGLSGRSDICANCGIRDMHHDICEYFEEKSLDEFGEFADLDTDILKTFQSFCENCGMKEEFHEVCSKYTPNKKLFSNRVLSDKSVGLVDIGDERCEVCGRHTDDHPACNHFIGSTLSKGANICEECGKNVDEHAWMYFSKTVLSMPHFVNASCFKPRENEMVKWLVDGESIFENIADAIVEAEEEILISDWFCSPEVYLKRPSKKNEDSTRFINYRLDNLLLMKAVEGVHVYVLLWNETKIAIPFSNGYAAETLEGLHENIKVITHPGPTGPLNWTHHEKLVVVDRSVAVTGGLDLCFGRYDTDEHVLVDDCPLNTQWPGKDYYNPRFASMEQVDRPFETILDRCEYPRLPWHDVSVMVSGDCAEDLAVAFIQRWNHHKEAMDCGPKYPYLLPHTKYRLEAVASALSALNYNAQGKGIPSDELSRTLEDLSLEENAVREGCGSIERINSGVDTPSGFLTAPSTPADSWDKSSLPDWSLKSKREVVTSLLLDVINSARTSMAIGSKSKPGSSKEGGCNDIEKEMKKIWEEMGLSSLDGVQKSYALEPGKSCHTRCQVVRSLSSWSGGLFTENSLERSYKDIILKAKHYIYMENQYFMSSAVLSCDSSKRNDSFDYEEDDEDSEIHEGDMRENNGSNKKQERPKRSSRGPHNNIAYWLFLRLRRAIKRKETFRVIILMPEYPEGSFQDEVVLRYVIATQYRSIHYGPNSLLGRLRKEFPEVDLLDYIVFLSIRSLQAAGMFSNCYYTSEQIYVHSKIIIADDNRCLIGSANINDRSLCGKRDSELGLFITDTEFVQSKMNGHPYKAGLFCHSLRMRLWCEHLGIQTFSSGDPLLATFYTGASAGDSLNQEVMEAIRVYLSLKDPVCDSTYKDYILETAGYNSRLLERLFSSTPRNSIRNLKDYEQALRVDASERRHSISKWRAMVAKEKRPSPLTGSKAGLGATLHSRGYSGRAEANKGADLCSNADLFTYSRCGEKMKGHLVFYPGEFLIDSIMNISLVEWGKNIIVSTEVFH